MGFIRGFGAVLFSILLLVSFLAMNLSLTFNLSLQYNNVKNQVGDAIKDYAYEDFDLEKGVQELYPLMQTYCNANPGQEYLLNQESQTVSISCDSVSKGSEAIIDDALEGLIENVYYKEYNCNFFDCLKEEGLPLFLISEKAKNYWKQKFVLALITSLVLIAVLLLLVEKKHNAFIISGSILALSSLPFIGFGSFLSSIDSLILVFVNIFFSKAKEVFVISIISGITLIIIGLLMKFFTVGLKLSEWIEKIKAKKDKKPEEEKPAEIEKPKKTITKKQIKKK